MPRRIQIVLVAALLTSGGWAAAQEFCVACKGPDATYRCVVGGEPTPASRGTPGQLLCIKELAKSGPHTSCSVQRRAEDEACLGELRTVFMPASPGLAAPLAADAPPPLAAQPAAPPPLAAQPAAPPPPLPDGPTIDTVPGEPIVQDGAEPAPGEPPETAGDSLQKAGEAIGDTAKSAGDAVGDAVKKTWNCLSSFFGDC